jgi:hypothetical protein
MKCHKGFWKHPCLNGKVRTTFVSQGYANDLSVEKRILVQDTPSYRVVVIMCLYIGDSVTSSCEIPLNPSRVQWT